MQVFVTTMIVIGIVLLLFNVYLLFITSIESKRYGTNKVLSGVTYVYKKNRVMYILLAIYAVVSFTSGILYIAGKLDVNGGGSISLGAIMSITMFWSSSMLFVRYGDRGVTIGRRFYEWSEVDSLVILADEKRYPEYEVVTIEIKSDSLSVKGYMVKEDAIKFQPLLSKQR